MTCFQMFYPGDKVFDIIRKKLGKIVNLRNDFREKKMREINPSHYYYHINYDDGTFNTYLFGGNLIKCVEENVCPETQIELDMDKKIDLHVYSNYNPGQRFINTRTNKTGTVRYLRNDDYEKNQRIYDHAHYYYHVDYDDRSFETYECGEYLKPI